MSDRKQAAIEQAGMWLEKIERTLELHESRALREWLQDPMHREVIVERCRLWHGPEILGLLSRLVPIGPQPSRQPSNEGKIVLGIFLTVWGLLIGAFLIGRMDKWSAERERDSLRAELVYRTSPNERRSVVLPDGSKLVLNGGSHLLVSYGVRARDLTLLRGEAMLDVVAEAERPFRLVAGARHFAVTAASCKFSIRRLTEEEVELIVVDGQVHALDSRLTKPLTPAQIRARLSGGDHMFTSNEAALLGPGWNMLWQIEPQELQMRLSWSDSVTY